MRRRIVAGNWKMNKTRATAVALAEGVAREVGSVEAVKVVVCPPSPYLLPVGQAIAGSQVRLGAQNCYFKKEGAFTGEVGPLMLSDVGCKYVILGHSERRHQMNEQDDAINQKVRVALEVGLRVILCVGETRLERDEGRMEEVFYRQLATAMAGSKADSLQRLVIAYEPVWAIGAKTTATPADAQQAHGWIRRRIAEVFDPAAAAALPILYGGGVTEENVRVLFEQPDVDGALVGGASLTAEPFARIVRAAVETAPR